MTLYLAYGNKVVKYMEYSYLLIIHLRVRVSDAVNRQEINPQYALRPSSEPEIFMYEIDDRILDAFRPAMSAHSLSKSNCLKMFLARK